MTNAIDIDSLRQLRDNARAIKANPAFVEWERQVMGQVEGRRQDWARPLANHDELYEQEYRKGEANGMFQAIKHWDLMIELLDTEVKEATENAEAEQHTAGTERG